MWWFIGLMLTVYFIACIFLIFVILIQSGKGGGLSSLGSASQGISDALGATGAERTLNKLTTWAAVGFMVLAIFLSLAGGRIARQKAEPLLPETPLSPVTAPGGPAGGPAAGLPAKRAAAPGGPIKLAPKSAAPAGPIQVAPKPAAPVSGAAAPVAPAAPAAGAKPAGQ